MYVILIFTIILSVTAIDEVLRLTRVLDFSNRFSLPETNFNIALIFFIPLKCSNLIIGIVMFSCATGLNWNLCENFRTKSVCV